VSQLFKTFRLVHIIPSLLCFQPAQFCFALFAIHSNVINVHIFQVSCFQVFRQKFSMYRVSRSRLTHFKFEYCAGAIACRSWGERERRRRGRHFIWSVAMERWNVQQRVTCVRSFGDIAWPARSLDLTVTDFFPVGVPERPCVPETYHDYSRTQTSHC